MAPKAPRAPELRARPIAKTTVTSYRLGERAATELLPKRFGSIHDHQARSVPCGHRWSWALDSGSRLMVVGCKLQANGGERHR
jgi:hypothetical protein